MMVEDELTDLAADIKAHGLREPLIVACIEGKAVLVDGRNWRAACKIAGVEPYFRDLEEYEDPTAYVLSANIHRRHMTKGQRAMAVAKICKETLREAAKDAGLSHQRVHQARIVLRYSIDDDLARDVLSGTTQLDAAYQVARERKKDAELSDEDRLAELRTRYPDLADKVEEGELTLAGAIAEANERDEQESTQRANLWSCGGGGAGIAHW